MASNRKEDSVRKYCGIIMPISEIDGCDATHWAEVKDILSDAISEAGFEPNLVSDADEVGVIHKRIIANLYEYEIVVCDVSAKNPNVMFELGLRLAFDKPTIIVKDNATTYSFDTSAIEHLDYPRDLRFGAINDFKDSLTKKITATHRAANSDASYTTFLRHFGEFKSVKIDRTEVDSTEYILDELRSLRREITRISSSASNALARTTETVFVYLPDDKLKTQRTALDIAMAHPAVSSAKTHSHEGLAFLTLELKRTFANFADNVKQDIMNHLEARLDVAPHSQKKQVSSGNQQA